MSGLISKVVFEQKVAAGDLGWKCSYEEYAACYCPKCDRKESCIHANAFRRMPVIDGGLGLCPRLADL